MINTDNLIDADAIKNLVQHQVDEIAKAEVNRILQNTNNLVETVKKNAVQSMINQLSIGIADLKRMIAKEANDLLSQRINSKEVNDIIKTYLRDPVEAELDELISREVNLENIIKGQVVNSFSSKLMQRFESTDIVPIIKEEIAKRFIDYVNNTASINLSASQLELSVMDDVVVVENELVANSVKIIKDLSVANLSVTDSIDQTTNAWKQVTEQIKNDVLEVFDNTVIGKVSNRVLTDFESKNIDLKGATLSGKKLLTEDDLKTIEKLNKLNVVGEAQINDTFFVVNKRVGINTAVPAMGLSVWDEEVNILAGKLKEKTAFVGTANQQSLSIGVNRREDLCINEDGLVKVNKLQVGQHRIKFETDLPGYSSTKGDITFNTNITQDNPIFAWVCLGGHNWLPLKG